MTKLSNNLKVNFYDYFLKYMDVIEQEIETSTTHAENILSGDIVVKIRKIYNLYLILDNISDTISEQSFISN
jgi:hypothetical protein